jgi:hypothetical protein
MNTFKVLAIAATLALGACHENPQHVIWPDTAKADTAPYLGPPFNGDKGAFEKALAARDRFQNEYNRMGGVAVSPETAVGASETRLRP